MKNTLIILMLILTFSLLFTPAYAADTEIFPRDDGNPIVEELDFCVQRTCSGHPSFIYYLVREDGLFAVYYRTAENTDLQDGIFSCAYIDVFNENGEFLAEISLRTRDELTLNFSSNALDIYLSECMLSVDLLTYEVTEKQTPRDYGKENGLHTKFIQKTQEAAGWSYYCKGVSMNYTSLMRENDDTEEVLLSLSGNVPGKEQTISSFAGQSVLSGCILLVPYLVWKLKRGKSQQKAD